jgi:GTP-binding protein
MAGPAPLQLEFVMSAPRVDDLPPTNAEVAFAGRSNVGKSSLINALANRKQLARVSKTPGRTRHLNLFRLPDGRTIVDLPGYGYAKAAAKVRAGWGPMIEGYVLGRDGLRAVIVLVDGEIGPTPLDVAMFAWLDANDTPYRIVATKHDKVKSAARAKRKTQLAEACGVAPQDVLWVSAAKNVNIDLLRSRTREWLEEP